MNRLKVGVRAAIIVFVGMWFNQLRGLGAPQADPLSPHAAVQAAPDGGRLLAATVRIVMYAPLAEGSDTYIAARGLGTRVKLGGKNFVVTHDHWGDVLDAADFVQFWSATSELLREMDGADVRNRILYRDGGTMVLGAPTDMPGLVPMGNPAGVGAAAPVRVVHQAQPDQDPALIEVAEATIVEVDVFEGNPSFAMRMVGGETIVYGDSGGGVFQDGALVGNMWATRLNFNWQLWTWASIDDYMAVTDEGVAAANPLPAPGQTPSTLLANERLRTLLFGE